MEHLHHRLAYSEECIKKNKKFPNSAFKSVQKIIWFLKKYNHTATFFVIGEILEEEPDLAKLIVESGNEIANHTYRHKELNFFKNKDEFEVDLRKTDSLIKKITGSTVVGFRAPKWSLKKDMGWVLELLKKLGYLYDASIYPSNGYGYGLKNSPIRPYNPSSSNILEHDNHSNFFEFPTLIFPLGSFRVPIKLRHFGRIIYSLAISRLNSCGIPATLTLHSWELSALDPDFLSLGSTGKNLLRNFRIPCMDSLEILFRDYNFISIRDYISANKVN